MGRRKCEFFGLSRDWIDVRLPMQWDEASKWFASTVGADVETYNAPARTGYREGLRAIQPQNAGSLSIIGDNPKSKGWSLFSGTGASAEWAWNAAVSSFEVGQANRVDAALDFYCSENAFANMLKEGESLCRLYNIRPHPMGTDIEGRTLYFNWGQKIEADRTGNEKKSQYTARLYEKGKQTRTDPSWRRFEVTSMPDKALQKERLFTLEPHEIIGSPEWSRAFCSHIGYSEAVKPARSAPYAQQAPVSDAAKEAKLMKSYSHLGEQYGAMHREAVKTFGEERARELLFLALERPVIVQDDGRETTGPAMLRRMAQERWGDVFHHDLGKRIHEAGAGGLLH